MHIVIYTNAPSEQTPSSLLSRATVSSTFDQRVRDADGGMVKELIKPSKCSSIPKTPHFVLLIFSLLYLVISMFSFKVIFPKKGLLNLFKFDGRNSIEATHNFTLGFTFTTRSLTSIAPNESLNFTVSYLINSCGLSEHKALYISKTKKIDFKSSSQPDSVLTLLRDYGFTNTHISKFILGRPNLLMANPNKTLKPKIEFFNSIGLCGTELAWVLSSKPNLLAQSLKNRIIPSIAFLKTIVHSYSNVIKVLKRETRLLDIDLQKNLAPKIALLQAHGVPDSNVLYLLMAHPRSLMRSYPDRLDEVVKKVKEMGFDPLKPAFVYAIPILTGMGKSLWEGKLNVYRRWGWSEEEIHMAFLKRPTIMGLSEKSIMQKMDVLVNKMGYDPSLIAQLPHVLTYSLEKRIIPRCSVLQLLIRKALVNEDYSIGDVIGTTENYFMKKYVTKFERIVPELLNVYIGKGKVNAPEIPG